MGLLLGHGDESRRFRNKFGIGGGVAAILEATDGQDLLDPPAASRPADVDDQVDRLADQPVRQAGRDLLTAESTAK
jgi:hypothetical protein